MAAPSMAVVGISFEPASPARPARMPVRRILAAIAAAALCAACQREAQAPPAPARPVRTVTVELSRAAPSASFAGQIEARDEVSLGFRIAGRMLERTVGVGAQVREGQVIARLDSEDELNALRSARAALAAAQGVLRQAENQYRPAVPPARARRDLAGRLRRCRAGSHRRPIAGRCRGGAAQDRRRMSSASPRC